MEFALNKCTILVLKHGVRVWCKAILLPDGQVTGEMDESVYKYLGVLEGGDITQKKMNEEIRKENLWRVKLATKSKLYGGSLIAATNE